MCIIYSVRSSIKFASGKELEGAWVDVEPVARTSLLSVPDWRLPVCKNARVLIISPTLKLSAVEARSFC